MALTSDTQPSPNGVNCIEHESADIEEDLEDGEIFEDEEPGFEPKSAPMVQNDKPKPVQTVTPPVVPPPQKEPAEPVKPHRTFENNDKPLREPQRVPFYNKVKRKFDDNEEEENRWKRDGKRNRRSHDFERDPAEPGRRHDGEPGEDEEEMMFVRGASPHRLEEEMAKWDREGEEGERGEVNRRPPRTMRGRGGQGRRGEQRQRGRGRGRGGNMRGNKRKRDDGEMCMFYMQGKCHRGSECPYAHEVLPPRKMELCKFYMKDCCAKKDKCLYMHSEFPCKYYHTGLKCYANKKCRFNHGMLNDITRNILAKHLDTAPKDILGEYPRRERDQRDRGDQRDMRGDPRDMRGDPRDMRGDPRDMRGDPRDMRGDPRDMRGDPRDMRGEPRDMRDMRDRDMRGDFMRNRNDRERKIPSLFDIKVSIPEELRNSGDGNHTPMPSPTQRSQDSNRSNERDRDNYTPERERERDKERDREREHREHEKHKQEKAERKAKREKAREHRKERKERKEKEKEKKRERSKDVISEKNELEEQDDNKNPQIMSPTQSDDNIRNSCEVPLPGDRTPEEQQDRKGLYEENGLIPQHLPKKQRELFLRIQQQQREAESSQASANDDDDENAEKIPEIDWYSSDEETSETATTLPSILHSLTNTVTSTSSANMTAGDTSSSVMPLLNLLATASAAAKPLDVNKAQVAAPFIPSNLDLANLSTVFEALTNLQKMSSSANIKKETSEVQTTTVATAVVKTEPLEFPKTEPAKPEPPRVRDPRLRNDGAVEVQRRPSEATRGPIDIIRRSIESPPSDVDLRLKPVVKQEPLNSDVDLRSLPFKPVQHSAASEIDASLSSHTPLAWQLLPADVIKADYSSLQIQPKPGVNDPRLRRVVRPPTDELGLPRDPRQRLLDEPVRDPRARQPLLATPLIPPTPLLSCPPTPRYDEDHRPPLFRVDSDMRQFPPPTPRLEEDVYIAGPSRPVDPRQRNLGLDDPRRNQFSNNPNDIDLRPPMGHRVPFINFK